MVLISGAGFPGVPSLDILGNVVPFISNEEDKLETEPRKMLGQLAGSKIDEAPFTLSAHCNRVPVEDGHTESVSVKLARNASADEMVAAWREFRGGPQVAHLPSAPEEPIIYMEQRERPQPRLDRDLGGGMSTSVGGLRPCNVFDWKFTVLSHNTIRGAAGATLLNAELLQEQGYLG